MDFGFISLNSFRTAQFEEYTYLLGSCFCTEDKKQIEESSQSILWFTYRTNFPAIGGDGPTSDKGWGCMLRCGQMLLAHALSIVHLGRSWQWRPGSTDEDYPQMGVNEGRKLCEWFGPNTISQCLKKLVIYDHWSKLAVHVAMDNVLFASDVRQLAATVCEDDEPDHDKRPKLDPKVEEKTWRPVLILIPLRLGLNAINRAYLKPIQVRSFESSSNCPSAAGILGGRPNHAVFFTGFSGEELFYLDPHTAQQTVDLDGGPKVAGSSDVEVGTEVTDEKDVILVEEADGRFQDAQEGEAKVEAFDEFCSEELEEKPVAVEQSKDDEKAAETLELISDNEEPTNDFNDSSFHCPDLQYMHFNSLDPSLALGFICACEEDFNDLLVVLKEKMLPASKPAIFELMDERPNYWPPYVPYTRAAPPSTCSDKDYEDFAQFDSGDEFEILQP
ncbi:Cysteine protease [Aphelenchoides fujianensis]|nr:Cysteine protease [Aphelenchoides fujianensis]